MTADLAPDGLPDDRAKCGQCRHLQGGRFCQRYKFVTWADLSLRCLGFMPASGLADQRSGLERWPTLREDAEELRKLEALKK